MDKKPLREVVALGRPLFDLGFTLRTWGADQIMEENEVNEVLVRHQYGDWSEMEYEDQAANSEAVKKGRRIFSSYFLKNGEKIWVITEADRGSTTILLPSEY